MNVLSIVVDLDIQVDREGRKRSFIMKVSPPSKIS